ncbi:MAG: glycosyltransferase family 4 protein [Planctomycetota bacterium]
MNSNGSAKEVLKILVLGTLPPPIGGTTVLLKTLVDDLGEREDVQLRIINTGGIRKNGIRSVGRLIGSLLAIVVGATRVHVISAHLNDMPFAYLGLFTVLAGRLLGRPVVMRKFGGNPFRLGRVGNWMAYKVMRLANVFLVETRALVKEAGTKGASNVQWYPNNRPTPVVLRKDQNGKKECRRFFFLGHVKKEKGICELIEASERLPEDVCVDVFGPFTSDLSERDFLGKQRIRYRGIVAPEDVSDLLRNYDAIVLPTYNACEGYPGVVIEGYMSGLPVVCTRWQALPEIVDETCGILVPPRDPDALYKAMKLLSEDQNLFDRLSRGALLKSLDFDSKTWTERFVNICRTLVSGGQTRPAGRFAHAR